MKIKETLKKLLTNKYVLNIVFIITFLNIIGRLMMHDIYSVIYFGLIALLVTFFSKNMIIVLGIPLILTSMNIFNKNVEGMETNTTKDEAKDALQAKVDTINKNSPVKNDLPMTPDTSGSATTSTTTTSDEPFEVGYSKNKSKYNIDYASTVEGAYDDLNKILGGDGIKNLTMDTQNLMKQQLQLAESMKSMGPMIETMKPLLDQAKGVMQSMGGVDGLDLGSITDLAKKFSASLPANK